MSSILVTGANGFVGHHLVHILKEAGHKVIGTGTQQKPRSGLENVLDEYIVCDLTKSKDVFKLPLANIDAVINLAGLAAVGKSFEQPDVYRTINVAVLSVMADRLKQIERKDLRVVAISTGAVYAPGQPLPLQEDSRTSEENSPYAASKLAMEQIGLGLRAAGFDCVIARPFNHIGPGQEEGFLLPDLYNKLQVATDEIAVGNLETKRDYTDVRDVARAYMALATQPSLAHDIYNVCTGRAVSGKEILKKLELACDKQDLRVTIDQTLFRPSDTPEIYGDSTRLRAETGWQPTITLDQTVQDFVTARR